MVHTSVGLIHHYLWHDNVLLPSALLTRKLANATMLIRETRKAAFHGGSSRYRKRYLGAKAPLEF
jgi:hypothetical protein